MMNGQHVSSPAYSVNVAEKAAGAKQQITNMFVNYAQLLIDCATDEDTRKDFLARPHYYLNHKVGMNIPESVPIEVDTATKDLRWPVVYISTQDGKIAVAENKSAVEVMHDVPSNGSDPSQMVKGNERIELKEWSEVDVRVRAGLKESHVLVQIPFYDVHDDMLTEITFDDAEIVLSVGC